MTEEHQAGVAKFARYRQTVFGPPTGAIERLFEIDLGTGATETGHALRHYLPDDAVSAPSRVEPLGLDEDIALVGGMYDVVGHPGDAKLAP